MDERCVSAQTKKVVTHLKDLRRCLRNMAQHIWNPDIGWVLFHLFNRGRVRVCKVDHGCPVFMVDLVEGDNAEGLIRTVRRVLDVAILNLCVERRLCFRMCNSRNGYSDLRFQLTELEGLQGHDQQ